MRTFSRFHEQIQNTLLLAHSRVLTVGKRAGQSTAETGQIVLMATELLCLGLDLVRTERFVDNTPDDLWI